MEENSCVWDNCVLSKSVFNGPTIAGTKNGGHFVEISVSERALH